MTSAHVTGININEYQIGRCNMYSKALNLDHLTSFQRGDFTQVPFENDTFDNAYCIEAAVHAPRLQMVYAEAFRTLKPGGMFACYEWCVTDAYDPMNMEQKRIIFAIEEGNSISKLCSTHECLKAAKSVGFEIIEADDLAVLRSGEVPWYDTLKGSYSISQFRMTKLGRWTTDKLVSVLETVRLAPPGARKVTQLLNSAADNLVAGGELGIFTPMFFWIGRKPDNA
ncbi:MAG: S-adenosyl-L-methionine-dependent methyltransferase [Olpidium bornovanus]|uniref:Sterol 24-C-methyltransferase n=1 Tax=Olpidium bornovanus TaxID=278681 RepID=A0A8H8DFX6_9FUNG|nr:MAG: S-adenosyl-L-methionine-dependent methyltransferase [Olpidium bornovanus]